MTREKPEDIKLLIRSRKSKTDRKSNAHTKKDKRQRQVWRYQRGNQNS